MINKKDIKDFVAYLKSIGKVDNQEDFGHKIGIKNKSYFSQLLAREIMDAELLNKINFVYPEFNDWLMVRKGKIQDGSIVKDNPSRYQTASKSFTSGRPFYEADWELGFKNSFDENLTNPEFNIDFPPANTTEGIWIRGKGKSMLGEIDPGDYIYFSPMEDFSWFPFGRIYGLVTKNKMRIVKRVVKSDKPGYYLLLSSNPDKVNYPDQEIPIEMITMMFEVKFVIKNLNE